MNAHPKRGPTGVPLDVELSATFSKIAKWAMPDLEGVCVVLVRPGDVSVQGGGSMPPRELARCLRAFADKLDEQSGRQAGLIVPGRS